MNLYFSAFLIGGLIILAVVIVALFTVFHPFQINAEDSNDFASQDLKSSVISSSSVPSVGNAAPPFTLPSTTNSNISLSEYQNKKNVLLYFQEGIMCAPCWDQIEDIQKEYDKFESLDIEVLTITVDPLNVLIKESKKRGISLPVLDDADLMVSKAYGVLDYSMHPGSRPGHSLVLVGKDGNIVWKKDYYPSPSNPDGGMKMGGMNMNMGGKMYVPVEELLDELYKNAYRLYPPSSDSSNASTNVKPPEVNDNLSDGSYNNIIKSQQKRQNNTNNTIITIIPGQSNITKTTTAMVDHSMCLTPIHNHADLKIYINDSSLNLAQRKYMDQSSDVHFHPTVKANSNDIPGEPFADIVHIHRDNVTIQDFLDTLDIDTNSKTMLYDERLTRVYVNGILKEEGLGYVINDKDRILVSYAGNNNESQIDKQIQSVTSYVGLGKDRNPSLFGGC